MASNSTLTARFQWLRSVDFSAILAKEELYRVQEQRIPAARISVTGYTDIGLKRRRNEDSIAIGKWSSTAQAKAAYSAEARLDRPFPLLISDGMGGHSGGNLASRLVIESLSRLAWRKDKVSELCSAIVQLELEMATAARKDSELLGMGATMVGTVLESGRLCCFNVGDSRAYLKRGGRFAQLTVDDRLSQSRLTQAIGGHSSQFARPKNIHYRELEFFDGDVLLLCTDGLSDVVDDQVISCELERPSAQAAESLITLARQAGAPDNISLIIARAVSD